MKRILTLMAVALVITTAAVAQTTSSFKVDKNSLVKEIERTNKTLENEKRATKGQPWFDNGNALYNAAAAVASQIYSGMPLADLTAKLGKDAPKPTEKTITLPGQAPKTYKLFSLPEADIYVGPSPDPNAPGEIVLFWVEKIVVYEGATEKSIESFKKAAELDKKLLPKVKEALTRVADIHKINANALYNIGESTQAAEEFLKAYELQKNPLIGVIDNGSVFNAGYLYISNDNFDKGIEVFEDAVANNIWEEGNIAYFLSWAYLKKGPDYYPKAKAILKKGLELFPQNDNISEGLINYYSISGDNFVEIIDVLEAARKKDPRNITFWNGLGQAYLKGGDRAKSIGFYREFVQAFPDDFTANYYLGDLLMEEGEAQLKEAENNASMSQTQKVELTEKANNVFREALPFSEKAYLDRPEEKAALQRVTRILFRLKDKPDMTSKFEKYNAIYVKSLEE